MRVVAEPSDAQVRSVGGMALEEYRRGCPLCQERLALVLARDRDTPPWLCTRCARGWWTGEVYARADVRRGLRDYGVDPVTVTAARERAELERAGGRPDNTPLPRRREE